MPHVLVVCHEVNNSRAIMSAGAMQSVGGHFSGRGVMVQVLQAASTNSSASGRQEARNPRQVSIIWKS